MPEIEPILPGLYARSETLVQATRDHDRDRIDDQQLTQAQARDLEDLLGVQLAAGFTTLTTGQLTWQDPFRPLTAVLDGLEPTSLVRFLDTNTFYRRPDLTGEPGLRADGLGELLETQVPPTGNLPGLLTLPSPTAFVTAALDEEGAYPGAELAGQVAKALFPRLLEALPARGVSTVILYDPWLAAYPDPGALVTALDPLSGPARQAGLELLFHLPFVDAAPVVAELASAPIDGLLVDLTLTDREALAEVPPEIALGVGVVDARSSLVERPDLVASTIAGVADELDHERLLATPTGDLQHVPEAIARRKVRTLGEAAAVAAAKLGGGTP